MNVPPDAKHPKNELLIPTLSPKENVTISYLYFENLLFNQINSYIKCDEGVAEVANLQHVTLRSPFLRRIIWIFLIIGTATVFDWVAKIIFSLIKICSITNVCS